MKKKALCSFLSFILIMLFPTAGICADINISSYFNADIIMEGDAATDKASYPDTVYNKTSVPQADFEINSVKYKIYGDLNVEGNDAIMISPNSSKDIDFGNSLVKIVGFIAATADGQAELAAKPLYEDGSSKNDISFSVLSMADKASDFKEVGNLLNKTSVFGKFIFGEGSTKGYFNAYSFENEIKKLSKVTFSNNSENTVYILAVSTVEFDEDEIRNEADKAINRFYNVYKDKKFTELDETTVKEVEQLRDGLVAGKQTGNEYSTDENIAKFSNMIEGYSLYTQWMKEKTIADSDCYFEKTEDDFLNFTADDKAKMEALISAYKNLEKLNYERLTELCDEFEVTEDINVSFENGVKTKALYDAYLIYLEIKELTAENASLYEEYNGVSIDSLNEADMEKISKYIKNCERITALGGNINYDKLTEMQTIKAYYANYLNSEKPVFADLSSVFNVETIAKKGEKTPENWFETSTAIHFWGKDYTLIRNLDIATGIITLDDQKCVVTPNANGTYSGRWNSTNQKFYLKLTGLETGVKDTLEISRLSENARTISLPVRTTDKIYIAMTSGIFNNPYSTAQEIIINYTDGSSSEPYTIYPSCGYNQSWGYSSADGTVYPYQNGYFCVAGSNALSNKNGSLDYVLRPQERENGVVGTYCLPADNTKQVNSITLGIPSVQPVYLYAITQKPTSNSVFINNAKTQWKKVENYDIENLSTTEIEEIQIMMSYKKEADERGILPSSYADAQKIALLSEVVLTINGKMERYNIDTVKATVEFSAAVSESALKSALSVSEDSENISDYSVELSEDAKKAFVDIKCNEKGGNVLKIEISEELSPKAYPNNKMPEKVVITYTVPEFITVKYADNKISVKNNSKIPTDYKLYFTYYNPNTGEVIFADKFEALSEINSENEHNVAFSEIEDFIPYIYVMDGDFNHIAYYSEIAENTASVEKGKDYKEISYKLSDNTITVSGFTPSNSSQKKVNLEITDANGGLIAFLTQKTDSYGAFKFNVKIIDEMILNEGYARIIISGDDFAVPYTNEESVYLSKTASKKNAILDIKNAENAEKTVIALKNAENKLGLSSSLFDAVVDSLGNRVNNVSSEFLVDDFDGAKNIILREALLEAFSQGKEELLLKDGKLLYSDIAEYEKIDTSGVTLYSVFKDMLTEMGKKEAVLALKGKPLSTLNELRNELTEATANSVLINCSKDGYLKYTCLLTNENALKLGIDISNYTGRKDKTALLNSLTSKVITNIYEFEKAVKAYNTSSKDNSGGGSSGGSSFGGGFSMTPDVWTNSDSSNDDKNNTPLVFKDVDKNHWAYSYISEIKEKNIINGNENGCFNPDKNITRAEFVKILVLSAGYLLSEGDNVFCDVAPEAWYFKYVMTAYENGIIRGNENNEFCPNAFITREDMCVMLYRLTAESKAVDSTSYSDNDSISEYALNAIAYLSEKGIVNGFSDNSFKPKDNATRAQCAKIIAEYLSK